MTKVSKKLLVDIGNSNTVFAECLESDFSFVTEKKTKELDDQFFESLFSKYDFIIVSSVVPHLNQLVEKFSQVKLVTPEVFKLFSTDVEDVFQVGADRLVNAYAAHRYYSYPSLIIDSGTAVTFCFLNEKGVYEGGAIIPGMGISSKALNDYTAKIPYIQVKKQARFIGKNTKEAVEIGLYHSYQFIINGFIQSFRKMYPSLTVIGTGKGLEVFKDKLELDIFDEHLILKGLALLANEGET